MILFDTCILIDLIFKKWVNLGQKLFCLATLLQRVAHLPQPHNQLLLILIEIDLILAVSISAVPSDAICCPFCFMLAGSLGIPFTSSSRALLTMFAFCDFLRLILWHFIRIDIDNVLVFGVLAVMIVDHLRP